MGSEMCIRDRVERMQKRGRKAKGIAEADPKDIRALKAAATGLLASLSHYGAQLLGELYDAAPPSSP